MASNEKKENSLLTQVPDRGWSWIVAVSCCLFNMLGAGTLRISTLLYVAMVKRLNISRKEASLPFSLATSLGCFSGPLAGFLADRFGVRLVTLTGGIFGAFGIGMCFFTQDIILITIFWGVLFGMGFGMGNTLQPVILNEHFDKYRATATGIVFSGGCLGSFFLPSLVEFCLREYELSGTFMILSGIVLNCIPLALLLRQPSVFSKHTVPKRTPSHFIDKHACDNNCSSKNGDTGHGKVKVAALNTAVRGNMKENDSSGPATNIKIPFPETAQLPSLAGHECLCEKSENYSLCNVNLEKNVNPEAKNIFTIHGNVQFYSIVKEKSQNIDLSDTIKTHTLNSETQNEYNSFRKNITFFRNPMFILIGMSTGLYGYIFASSITVLADFAVDIGVGIPKVPYILMSLSVGGLFGRISLGSLVDKRFMTVMQYTATFFLLQALSIASLAWATGFCYLIATSFVYGVCEGGIVLSGPLLVTECIETRLQKFAIPSIHVFSGSMYLTIPTLIGLFREQIGSYVGIFYTMSGISLICAATWFTLAFCMKHRS